MPRIYTRIPIEERFWKFVVTGPDCWKWTGALANKGYGAINAGGDRGRVMKAHRVSWKIHKGPIPEGLFVLHRCDNPPCTNPAHLFLGTNFDNVQDAVAKGRNKGGNPMGENHHRAKLSDAQILAIREEYRKGGKSLKMIAIPYGVTLQTVWRIVHWRTRV